MTETTTTLATFYKGWDVYQQHLVTAIAPLTHAQLDLRAAPHMWSVGRIATHILATRVGWFHWWMGEGSVDIAPMVTWDDDEFEIVSSRSAAEIVAGLELTWQMMQDALMRWTPTDLSHVFYDPYPHENAQEKKREHTRQWIIWHVLEHDLHHGGEISLALGIHKVAAIDL
jgi:uncharacterized damage-inducible protein DinB